MSHQLHPTRSRPHLHGAASPRRLAHATDERLVSALRRGDERAFEVVYDRYSPPLLGFCRHMLGSLEEAEDALQHVFVAAHRHLLDPSRPVQLKPWLYTVARNRCISMLRQRQPTSALQARYEPSTDGLAVADEIERREGLAEMLSDLARLPEDQRAALLLAEVEDLSHKQIGAALGVPAVKVKALIFQARTTLAGWRQARAADCGEIQQQLATLRGSALRRAPLRRHVAVCAACATFEREVAHQRRAMALLLPVVPSAALKEGILGAASTGAAATAAGATGGGIAGLTAKLLAATMVAVGAGTGGVVAVRDAVDRAPARQGRRSGGAGEDGRAGPHRGGAARRGGRRAEARGDPRGEAPLYGEGAGADEGRAGPGGRAGPDEGRARSGERAGADEGPRAEVPAARGEPERRGAPREGPARPGEEGRFLSTLQPEGLGRV